MMSFKWTLNCFQVPAFDRDNPGSGRACIIDQPTENVFFEIVKVPTIEIVKVPTTIQLLTLRPINL